MGEPERELDQPLVAAGAATGRTRDARPLAVRTSQSPSSRLVCGRAPNQDLCEPSPVHLGSDRIRSLKRAFARRPTVEIELHRIGDLDPVAMAGQ